LPTRSWPPCSRYPSSGWVYAAYGGVFITLSLGWDVLVDGFCPDRYDLLGALICVAGVLVMVGPSRG
jgi:small multidrug resistance family-3 protein